MTNEEHTALFNLIGPELMNEKILQAKNMSLFEFMKQIQLIIDSNQAYKIVRIDLKLLGIKFHKYVNS